MQSGRRIKSLSSHRIEGQTLRYRPLKSMLRLSAASDFVTQSITGSHYESRKGGKRNVVCFHHVAAIARCGYLRGCGASGHKLSLLPFEVIYIKVRSKTSVTTRSCTIWSGRSVS